ncbi:MAG: hypothetical protein HY301_02280 [Verrucomicrobia bacterium]|nr:hypothetical protein [Verrucomicrobiota bacterium]
MNLETFCKCLAGALVAGAWCFVSAFFGTAMTGAGHGTSWFLLLPIAPLGAGLILWPCIGFLLGWRGSKFAARVAAVLVIISYVGFISSLIWVDDGYSLDGFRKAIQSLPGMVSILSALYLAAQAVCWYLIVTAGRVPPRSGARGN